LESAYARQYRELWQRHWWWQARHEAVMQRVALVASAVDAGRRCAIFDVGCGGGLAFDDLARWGDVTGIEPDPLLVDAVPRWRHCIERASFDDYRTDRRFDLVLMLDVLEHLEDDRGAVARVAELLRPGGHFLLTVPALPSLWSIHDEVNRHYRRYRHAALVRLLHEAVLEPVEVCYLFTWPLGMFYMRRLFGPRKGSGYRVTVPGPLVNAVCRGLCRLEEGLLGTLRLARPIGSSLLALARLPVESQTKSSRQAA
jgi:2-polyprenyl-3-methyl-5-hydroxy-6-metoxy-1,4-benzoquinol methylase